jgi:hypothetical protein
MGEHTTKVSTVERKMERGDQSDRQCRCVSLLVSRASFKVVADRAPCSCFHHNLEQIQDREYLGAYIDRLSALKAFVTDCTITVV